MKGCVIITVARALGGFFAYVVGFFFIFIF